MILYGSIRGAALARAPSSRLLTIMRHAHLDLPPPLRNDLSVSGAIVGFLFWAARMSAAIG
jgi:hypothetical protein